MPAGQPIKLVARSDSSGTSQVFSSYLAGGLSLNTGANPACAAGVAFADHPFGPVGSAQFCARGAKCGYFFSSSTAGAPVFPGGATPTGYAVNFGAGTQARLASGFLRVHR